MLAQRLRPDERLNFDQAVIELERAVEIALDVITRGERGTNDDAFVPLVLTRVAEKIRSADLDGGAHTVNQALAELETRHQQLQIELEAGIGDLRPRCWKRE
jgi:hypothetical protein